MKDYSIPTLILLFLFSKNPKLEKSGYTRETYEHMVVRANRFFFSLFPVSTQKIVQ